MKSILSKSLTCLSVLSLGMSVWSCSDSYMDKINEDTDHTTSVPAKSILADVLTSTAVHNVGGDMDTYISSYNEYEVGVYNQLWNTEYRIGTTSSTTFGDSWNSVYSDLKNARIIIEKCSNSGSQSGNLTTKGIGEVMAAINSAIITDNFGDAPYSQAALPDLKNGVVQYNNPVLDKQKVIYDSIMNYLDAAIKDLPQGDNNTSGGPGAYDYLYAGSYAKWLKLAYGLKARYTMRLLPTYSASEKTAMMDSVLSYVSKSFTSTADQAAYNKYGTSNWNPYYDFFISRTYFGASESYVTKLSDRNDPRLKRLFVGNDDVQSTGHYVKVGTPSYGKKDSLHVDTIYVAPNGTPDQTQGEYSYSVYSYAATAPTFYMSYHELLFLEAEAYERLGQTDNAKATLKEAVVAAIANTENNITNVEDEVDELSNDWGEGVTMSTAAITAAQAASYFDNTVAPLFDTNPMKEITVQKYLALFGPNGEALEEYADIRRHKALGEDYFSLVNPLNAKEYPWSLPYGSSGVTSNVNVKAAYGDGQYIYTNTIWWAGGTGKAGN